MESTPTGEVDRRALLRKLAVAGAVGWTSPIILSSSPAAAGVFTAKCAPGAITATNSFVQTGCTGSNTTLTVTINFAGPCPCGGTKLWCAQKNAPGAVVFSSSSTLTMTGLVVPINGSITISGRVALGCTDRDGDTQYARYNWTMTATDNGAACNVANSISGVTLSARTLFTQATCPTLSGFTALAAPVFSPSASPGYVRPAS
jgi:hypothetical protein